MASRLNNTGRPAGSSAGRRPESSAAPAGAEQLSREGGRLLRGRIIRALRGFYYVQVGDREMECQARGVFRKREQTPYVGDQVEVECSGQLGYIMKIEERKNFLIRPPLANIDQLVMTVSILEPAPNTLVLDKLIAIAELKGIEPVVVVTKADLAPPEQSQQFLEIYRRAGFETVGFSAVTGQGLERVKELLRGRVSGFCGNSGVGKTTLLNCLEPALSLDTGSISKKLGRGRHTTRHVELFPLFTGEEGPPSYIADTPGFSAIEVEQFDTILKEQLPDCFREFAPYIGKCKFTSCSHTCEKGCAVLEGLEKGEIALSRHESYRQMYADAKNIKEWELKDR